MLMSPGKADRIIEANMATGVKYNSLVQNSSDISTVIAITMFDTAVSQPALKFTAVLENDPACTMQLFRDPSEIVSITNTYESIWIQ